MKIVVIALLMALFHLVGADDFLDKEITPSSKYAEGWYDSDDAYKFMSITSSEDYTGFGFYPMEK